MEKKTEVTTSRGYRIKVADHMVSDLAKFGATKEKPQKKDIPAELLSLPPKLIKPATKVTIPTMREVTPLPEMKITEPAPAPVIPEMHTSKASFKPLLNADLNPNEGKVSEPKKRKPPVRSKSTK